MAKLIAASILAVLLSVGGAFAISPDREPEPSASLSYAKMLCDYHAAGAAKWENGFAECATIENRWNKYQQDKTAWRKREDQKAIKSEIEAVHEAPQ